MLTEPRADSGFWRGSLWQQVGGSAMIRPVFLSVIGLVLGAAGIAAYSGASAGRFVKVSAIQQTEKADLVVLDARVLTVDDKRPEAEAFAVRDGKFIAVGTAAEVRAYIGPQTTVWNLRGKTITPGFNDAHIHPSPVYNEDSPHFVPFLGPPQVRTMDDLIAALKRKAARTPKGEWVMGTRFQDTKLGRWPTRYDLDKVSTEHPILISHSSGHVSVANSLALEKGRITRDTPNPPGGEIGHDEKGEPNGFLGESARRLLGSTSSERKPTTAEIEGGYVECFRRYLAKGITSIGIAGTSFDTVATMRTLHEKGKLPLRLNIMLREGDVSALAKRKAEAPLDDPWIRLGSIKLFHGNSLSGRTCWLYEPYADRPTY
jgi:predicted amidohydrolase YtcJ